MRTKVKYLICKWGRFLNGLVMSALGPYTIRPPCFNIQAFKHRYINKTQSKFIQRQFIYRFRLVPVGLKLLLDVFGAGAGGSAWTADVLGPFASAGLSGPELWVPSLFCAPRDRLPLPLPLPRSEDIPGCQKIKRQNNRINVPVLIFISLVEIMASF